MTLKKLRLEIESLSVESFVPAADRAFGGTVMARGWSDPDCQQTVEPQATCAITCAPSCRTCIGDPTCAMSCSCDTYCGTPSCVNTCGCEPY